MNKPPCSNGNKYSESVLSLYFCNSLIASGGMSSIDDLKKLKAMGIYGAITGKALYEGKITMAEIRSLGGM